MKFLKKLGFLSVSSFQNKQKLPHKFCEVPRNSYKARSYSEVNQKLFNVMETFLNYFEYVIKIFFNNEPIKLASFPKAKGV